MGDVMARTIVKLEFDSAGFDEVLKSAAVREELQARADRVKSRVEQQFLRAYHYGTAPRVIADTYVGQTRAGATIVVVHPEALAIEQRYRFLGSAIDSAGIG